MASLGVETTDADDNLQFMLSLLVSVTSPPTMATLYLVHLFGFADFYRAVSQTVIHLLHISTVH